MLGRGPAQLKTGGGCATDCNVHHGRRLDGAGRGGGSGAREL